MKLWQKTLLTALAGILGGFSGVALSYFVIAFALSLSLLGLLASLFIVALCPIAGAFSSMIAATFAGRFLDRYD